VCREPLSAGLQNVIDRASSGTLLKSLKDANYDALYHLYANIYLREDKTGKIKTFRIEKNQRVEILDKMPPPKGGVLGKCMSVPNIKPNTPWAKFFDNTNADTWQYSANKNNCQAFLKTRLEALGLLTPELKEFIMQDIDKLIPGKEIQKSIAKGITNVASILQNIYKGGEMEGGMTCNCGTKCGCGQEGGQTMNHYHMLKGPYSDATGPPFDPWMYDQQTSGKGKRKKGKGFAQPHKHDPQTGEVYTRYLEPNWWNYNRDYK
jgi:hypothetical protein